jgi:N4-gp56 family major capsid protein
MAYNEPGKGKLVGYAQKGEQNLQSQYNSQAGVTIKPDAYYDMMLLKMLRQMEFHYSKYAIQKSLPKNYGDTINWRRFKKLEVRADRGLLTEGVTPEGKEGISGESITAVIQQYGEVMYFTDLVDIMQLDDVRREYTIELGYIAQETLDLIVRDVLVAEGSVFYAGGAADAAALAANAGGTNAEKLSAIPKIDDFRRMLLGFKRDYVSGVRGASGRYIALISPEVMFALFDDERMIQYMNFGQTNAPLQDGVAIDMFGIRFEEVLNAPIVNKDGELLHDSIVLADEAYAITKLAGEGNVRVITKGLGSAGVSDPLDQRQSIGYKITGFGAKVLRPESVINYWSVPNAASGITFDSSQVTKQEASRSSVFTGGSRPAFPTVTVSFEAAGLATGDATLPIDKTVVIEQGGTLAQAIAALSVAPVPFFATDSLVYEIGGVVTATSATLSANSVVIVKSVPDYKTLTFKLGTALTNETNDVSGLGTDISVNERNGKPFSAFSGASEMSGVAAAAGEELKYYTVNGTSSAAPSGEVSASTAISADDDIFVYSV